MTRVFFFKSVVLKDWQVFQYFGFFFRIYRKLKKIHIFSKFLCCHCAKICPNKNGGSDYVFFGFKLLFCFKRLASFFIFCPFLLNLQYKEKNSIFIPNFFVTIVWKFAPNKNVSSGQFFLGASNLSSPNIFATFPFLFLPCPMMWKFNHDIKIWRPWLILFN